MQIILDRVMYQPKSHAAVMVEGLPDGAERLGIELHYLGKIVFDQTVDAGANSISIPLPDRDYTGYLLIVRALDRNDRELDIAMSGLDCSSTWTKFPRYGYLWDYEQGIDTSSKIAKLSRYHLNGLQFYDWQYQCLSDRYSGARLGASLNRS